MTMSRPRFDLPGFLRTYFPGLAWPGFGDVPVFYNTPIGLRFELGGGEDDVPRAITRGVALYRALFAPVDHCIVAAITWETPPGSVDSVFSHPAQLSLEGEPTREEQPIGEARVKVLQWVTQLAGAFDYERIIELLAKADFRSAFPAAFTAGDVYFIAPDKLALFHMYDDRGVDIAAVERDTLAPLYRRYNEWLLDHDRRRIDAVFSGIDE